MYKDIQDSLEDEKFGTNLEVEMSEGVLKVIYLQDNKSFIINRQVYQWKLFKTPNR